MFKKKHYSAIKDGKLYSTRLSAFLGETYYETFSLAASWDCHTGKAHLYQSWNGGYFMVLNPGRQGYIRVVSEEIAFEAMKNTVPIRDLGLKTIDELKSVEIA